MLYIVTVRRVDSDQVLNTVTCPDLPSALRVKSKAFRSHHFNDLGGQVVVPPTLDFDDWDDVDRLRYGNRGPLFPVRVSVATPSASTALRVRTNRAARRLRPRPSAGP